MTTEYKAGPCFRWHPNFSAGPDIFHPLDERCSRCEIEDAADPRPLFEVCDVDEEAGTITIKMDR